MTPDESTGERVHRLRRKARMTQAELAAAMGEHGWHPTTVARTEDNERVLRLPEAQTLARIFGLGKVEDLSPQASRPLSEAS
jgi:transcriptional regulator with XRE-family HTH domain